MPKARPRPKAAATPPAARLASLDAYRGFVILSMIFVNYLGGMPGIPSWLEHAPGDVDAYTFADLVFPGFLFISGAAIPYALGARLAKGEAVSALFKRVLERALILVALGVMMVNGDNYSPEAAGLRQDWWRLFAYVGAAVYLWLPLRDPKGAGPKPAWLAWGGLALWAAMMLLYRGKQGEQLVWLRPQWWGILGIIGWSYLAAAGTYLLVRGRSAALMAALGLMLALYVGGKHGRLGFLGPLNALLDIGGLFGTHAGIMTAGILAGQLVKADAKDALRHLVILGAGLFAAGQLIRPLHGVSKIQGTDAYALVTAGINCLAFASFHWLLKRPGRHLVAALLIPAGLNPLLAYLLPDVVNSLLGLTGTWNWLWPLWNTGGTLGLLNALAVTGVMMGLVAWMNRRGFFLRL